MINRSVGSRKYFETAYSSRDWKFYRFLLSEIMTYASPGPILDVGAGAGFFVEAALRWGLDCVGIEGSEPAIEIAMTRYPKNRLVRQLLSEQFEFADESFQTVVMNQVIEHLEPEVAENAVKESFRVLRPGGILYITSPSKFNRPARIEDPTHINMLSPTELKTLLMQKGFTKIVPLDSPIQFLGKSYIVNKVNKTMRILFNRTHWERLSSTANCLAYKLSADI